MNNLFNLLAKLSNANGVSGDEEEIRNIIHSEIKGSVDDCRIDKLGNLICHQKGKGHSIVLAAHMDEVGLIVKETDQWGHVYFSPIGGLNPETLIGQRVFITAKPDVMGVVTTKEIHTGNDANEPPKLKDMYIDTGLNKKELYKRGVRIGNSVVLGRKLKHLGSKDIVSGKALDNRIGCAILIELARKLKNKDIDVYYIFTVQEEVGLYGAKTSLYNIEAHMALAIDVTHSNDFFDTDGGIGRGVVIVIKDAKLISHKKMVNELISTAKKKNILYQLEVSDKGTTDGLMLSLSKGGLPTAVVSVAVRNLHSTISVANLKDIKLNIDLLEAFLIEKSKSCTFC